MIRLNIANVLLPFFSCEIAVGDTTSASPKKNGASFSAYGSSPL
jgi:hypothetical protein